jgi:hypothetical protein
MPQFRLLSRQAGKEEMMPKKLLFMMLAGVMLGCGGSAGQKFDTSMVEHIQVGQTKEAEVLSMLGTPWEIQKISNGSYVLAYQYGHRAPLGVSTGIDSLRVQIYDGVVIHKWEHLDQEY